MMSILQTCDREVLVSLGGVFNAHDECEVLRLELGAGVCVWSHAVTSTGTGGGQLTPGPETLGVDNMTCRKLSVVLIIKMITNKNNK